MEEKILLRGRGRLTHLLEEEDFAGRGRFTHLTEEENIAARGRGKLRGRLTHLVEEEDLAWRRVGSDGAGEVHVDALPDAGGVQASPDGQGHHRRVCSVRSGTQGQVGRS